eukprot:4927315-Lingulodinium_polyedra.AAC.1
MASKRLGVGPHDPARLRPAPAWTGRTRLRSPKAAGRLGNRLAGPGDPSTRPRLHRGRQCRRPAL